MITRLGTTSSITSNSGLLDILAHPIDALSYSVTAIQDTIEGVGAPDLRPTLPNPIILTQGAPQTVYQMTSPGAYTPEDAAQAGLADEQAANSAMLANYLNTVNNDPLGLGNIPWGTIAIIGACVLGFVVIVPMLGKK